MNTNDVDLKLAFKVNKIENCFHFQFFDVIYFELYLIKSLCTYLIQMFNFIL